MNKKETHTLNVFTVKWFKGSEALDDPHYVRREVFIKEQNVSEEEEMDEADYFSLHVVVYDNLEPVGTGRIFEEAGTFLIGRIAVLKEYRGRKVGKLIMEKLLEQAALLKEGESPEVHLHAQTYAVGFYEKLGFSSYGEIFQEADIEHVCMMKKL